jgi:hypothetical protein
MRRRLLIAVALFVVVGVGASIAATQRTPQGTYHCQVTSVMELMDDGSLKEAGRGVPGVGARFNVDRATGLIAGEAVDNSTSSRTEVVFTPANNLFFVVSRTDAPVRQVTLLSVRDSAPGRKPFIYVSSSWVYSGLCDGV